ncbi:hypothetical protein ACVRXQ_02690 [Streptococcus panodentis]|uniref:Phage protein n=1 Tax=Streptococcus panodentis TaxID=1581472 RepID=A0ABS5AYZ9_9STRE|nr:MULTISPECIES: hypothetical protein [Streptococcus]KXT84019.1 hypothetical protein STRDD11_01165 [Streptococcus sp. DD11]MBP2621803.1 hypothetical protein [Streptococcus panodentis]
MAEKINENLIIQLLKHQQRAAVRAAVTASVAAAKAKREALQQTLNSKAQELQDYAKNTYSTNITDGLEGQAADAAKDYLSQMPKPELTSPIKS